MPDPPHGVSSQSFGFFPSSPWARFSTCITCAYLCLIISLLLWAPPISTCCSKPFYLPFLPVLPSQLRSHPPAALALPTDSSLLSCCSCTLDTGQRAPLPAHPPKSPDTLLVSLPLQLHPDARLTHFVLPTPGTSAWLHPFNSCEDYGSKRKKCPWVRASSVLNISTFLALGLAQSGYSTRTVERTVNRSRCLGGCYPVVDTAASRGVGHVWKSLGCHNSGDVLPARDAA